MNRFRAHKQWIDGIEFASKKEARRYQELKLLERAGQISELTCHPAFKVEIAGQHYCRYTPDFSYVTATNLFVIEEVKSSGTRKDAAYRLRKKAMELYHNLKVTELVM